MGVYQPKKESPIDRLREKAVQLNTAKPGKNLFTCVYTGIDDIGRALRFIDEHVSIRDKVVLFHAVGMLYMPDTKYFLVETNAVTLMYSKEDRELKLKIFGESK